jgi:hypothetical protein
MADSIKIASVDTTPPPTAPPPTQRILLQLETVNIFSLKRSSGSLFKVTSITAKLITHAETESMSHNSLRNKVTV